MDNNNQRPTQSGGEPAMDAGGDWRSQLQADSRRRIVTKIMDTLKRHLTFSEQEELQEIERIAVRFEEKIYTAATSQYDYLRKISLKMLTLETKNPMPNTLQSNSSNNGQNPPDPDFATELDEREVCVMNQPNSNLLTFSRKKQKCKRDFSEAKSKGEVKGQNGN